VIEAIEQVSYPRLLRRVQAVLIDSLILPIVLLSVIMLVGISGSDAIWLKVLALCLPILVLEPGMVAFTGGTPGHHFLGIRVRKNATNQNINFIQASVRFVTKLLLGWISLIIVLTSKRHQAIHDLVVNSIVVNSHPETLPLGESLRERVVEEVGYRYPSRIRRAVIVVIYLLAAFFIINLQSSLFVSDLCIYSDRCSAVEAGLIQITGGVWLLSIGLIVVFGWKARLYGCRRKSINTED